MINKGILICTFVKKNNILCFIEQIKNEFHIQCDKIFVYNIENNEQEYLVTFKVNNHINLNGILKNSSIAHTKNKCIFSINALNLLLKKIYPNQENITSLEINWDEYKNKLLINAKNILHIENITKIDDLSILF